MIIKRSALKTALHCTTSDDSRYFLQGVHILPDGTVEATDGSILVRVKERHQFPDEDFPIIPGAASPLEALPEGGIILPNDLAKKLIAATCKKATIPILAGIQLGTSDGHAYARATDLQAPLVICLDNAQENQFPKTDHVMIKEGAREGIVKLTLSAAMLGILAALGKEIGRSKGLNAITLEIPTAGAYQDKAEDVPQVPNGNINCPVRFTAQGDDLTVEGVVMPCRNK